MGISLSTDSTATTQNAARFAISLEHQSKIKFSIFASTEVIEHSDHQISSRYETQNTKKSSHHIKLIVHIKENYDH